MHNRLMLFKNGIAIHGHFKMLNRYNWEKELNPTLEQTNFLKSHLASKEQHEEAFGFFAHFSLLLLVLLFSLASIGTFKRTLIPFKTYFRKSFLKIELYFL